MEFRFIAWSWSTFVNPLAGKIAVLNAMSPINLRERWQHTYGTEPPPGFGPDLLARRLAYDLQKVDVANLPIKIVREISRGILELTRSAVSPDRAPVLRPGTRLVREWHGHTHQVYVIENGFEYLDQRYTSLTAIAEKITSTHRSGPRFFGLVPRKSA
jgi:hypothetical protein